jgi:CDGSH-type Zn-finger protein
MDDAAKITPYRNGPYLIRGPFTMVDQEGNEIEVRRRVIALCRCGRSQTRPFCDGTHKAIGFRAESGAQSPGEGRPASDPEPSADAE